MVDKAIYLALEILSKVLNKIKYRCCEDFDELFDIYLEQII